MPAIHLFSLNSSYFLLQSASRSVKSRWQPFDLHVLPVALQRDHIKAARRCARQAADVMLRGEDDAPSLRSADAGCCAAVIQTLAMPHLHKHQRAIRRAHDEIDLAAAAPRRFEIARDQHQAARAEVFQSALLAAVTSSFGCGALGCRGYFSRYALEKTHRMILP
jgi:hypothetical protein